ncbi:Callose synthase 7 [Asimina triloba]
MDAQIWYAIFSTIFGGIIGAFSHLGEIRTLGMLRSRFEAVPSAFSERLVPSSKEHSRRNESVEDERKNIAKFSQVWNEFINSLREEDLISNKDKDLLLVPYSARDISVVQWPPFLLASKIPIALDMAKDFKGRNDEELFKKIRNDHYMHSAVIECYETLREILFILWEQEQDKSVVRYICREVEISIQEGRFLDEFRMSELPLLSNKLERLLNLLKADQDLESNRPPIINVLQDIMEIITHDVMVKGHVILERTHLHRSRNEDDKTNPKFASVNLNIMTDSTWKEKVVRLFLLLTTKESAINVPTNLDARRRITFFTNSFVLTPYYKEDVLYSEEEYNKENEDGISILFYLQKIYPVLPGYGR